jgi:hypothetical protein
VQLNGRVMRRLGVSRRELFETVEHPTMRPLPDTNYEYAERMRSAPNGANLTGHLPFQAPLHSGAVLEIRKRIRVRFWRPLTSNVAPSSLYVPNIRKAVSDLDRARFIKHTFEVARQHFEIGLHVLGAEPAIDAELTQRGNTEFVAEIFVDRSRKARCRIWLGGMLGGNE